MRSIHNRRALHQRVNLSFPIRQSTLHRIETAFATVGLLFYSGGIPGVLNTFGVSFIVTALRYSIFFVSAFILLSDFESTKRALRNGRYVWPLVLLTLASFIWSVLPASTIQTLRSDFIPITVFGIYLAARFSRKQMFEMLYFSLIATAAVSLFYAAFIPSIGRHAVSGPWSGAWKGISSHKNGFGIDMTAACVFAGIRLLLAKRSKLVYAVILALLFGGILLSQSMSALILSIATLSVIVFYQSFRWKGKSTVLFLDLLILILVGIVEVATYFWVPMLEALGKDPTISGRTLIWDFLLRQPISQAPILGHGKGAFWFVPALFSRVYEFADHVPAHAHNGYVELLIDLGYVGLLLFVMSLIPVIAKVLTIAYRATKPEDVWPLAVVIFTLVINVVESALLRGASFFWLLYIVVACLPYKEAQGVKAELSN